MQKQTETVPTPKKQNGPLHVIGTVFSWIVVVIAVSMMVFTVVSVMTFDRNDRNILGYKAFIVRSDSMKGEFEAGDLILTKNVNPSTLKEGDIITFQSTDPDHYGEVITHKIRSLTTDASGQPGFITYGIMTDTDDKTVVTYSFVLGKYAFHIPKVGLFFQFLKTTPGYIICILIPFLTMILMQGYRSVKLFKQYRYEQEYELELEKRKIDEERRRVQHQMEQERMQSMKMMEELMRLKAQMGGNDPNKDSPPAPVPDNTNRNVQNNPNAYPYDQNKEDTNK